MSHSANSDATRNIQMCHARGDFPRHIIPTALSPVSSRYFCRVEQWMPPSLRPRFLRFSVAGSEPFGCGATPRLIAKQIFPGTVNLPGRFYYNKPPRNNEPIYPIYRLSVMLLNIRARTYLHVHEKKRIEWKRRFTVSFRNQRTRHRWRRGARLEKGGGESFVTRLN